MSPVVPHSFLFRYAFAVPQVEDLPLTGNGLVELPEAGRLPTPAGDATGQPFGELRLGWNLQGIGLSLDVSGKGQPVRCTADQPTESDGLQIWIDTRSTQTVHRATRFCHQFCLLPAGGGPKGTAPVAIQVPIARARDEGPPDRSELVQIRSQPTPDGYRLEVWLPAAALTGFDAEASPRLGFYYWLRDGELGDQFLSVGPEFPIAHDPSLWAVLELASPRRSKR